jgi:peptidoglycan/LPS O-acetylase OafA/YrhL
MFFVLSGYCISASARKAIEGNESPGSFLYRRVRRVYPPYWFSILVVSALPFVIELLSSVKTGRYVAPSGNNPNYGFIHYGPLDWVALATLTRVFVPVPDAASLEQKFTSINAVYWTLAIEVQFYIAVSLAMLTKRAFYKVLLTFTVLAVPFSLVRAAYQTGLFLPYWPMFAIGVAVFWSFEHGYALSHLFGGKAAVVSAVLISLCGAGFLLYSLNGFPVSYLGFAAFFGFILLAAEAIDPQYRRSLTSRRRAIARAAQLLTILGAMSYSLYLVHGRLQFLSLQVARQLLPKETIALDIATITLTILMCYPFYLFCERPFIGSMRRRPEEVEALVPALGIAEASS